MSWKTKTGMGFSTNLVTLDKLVDTLMDAVEATR